MARYEGGRGNDTLDFRNRGDRDVEIFGSDGDDLIFGVDGNDTLDGGRGNDTIYGERGNDIILGGRNDDNLYGRDGDDRIIGEEGRDNLWGDAGRDTFFFSTRSDLQDDRLRDFSVNDGDKIEIRGQSFNVGISEQNRFSYDFDSGDLFFDDRRIAQLPTRIDFAPRLDINIV
ncbi:MAG: calcium-binding protein [Xenococcaceae cyanobacterium]